MTSPSTPTGTQQSGYLACREVLDFIMAYLDEDLTPAQRREFDRHLGVCPSCTNYLDSYKATIKLGQAINQGLDEPATGSVPDGLLRAIREARLKRA